MLFFLTLFASAVCSDTFESLDEWSQIDEVEDEFFPMDRVTSKQWCDICKEVAQFAEDLVLNHGGQALRQLIYTKLCDKKAGTWKDICKSAADKVIDLAAELVRKLVPTDKICTTVKLC